MTAEPTAGLRVALVVAVADNGVIGRGLALPWHLPADLQHFKAVTMGKALLMGSRTFASLGKPLPGRRNLVLTRSARAAVDRVEVVRSLDQALERCAALPELCVIGGADVYRQALPLATRLYLTRVHAAPQGDVLFPELNLAEWRETLRRMQPPDSRHEYAMTFLQYERASSPS